MLIIYELASLTRRQQPKELRSLRQGFKRLGLYFLGRQHGAQQKLGFLLSCQEAGVGLAQVTRPPGPPTGSKDTQTEQGRRPLSQVKASLPVKATRFCHPVSSFPTPVWDPGLLTSTFPSLARHPHGFHSADCLSPQHLGLAARCSSGDWIHSRFQVLYIRMKFSGSPAQKRINISDL